MRAPILHIARSTKQRINLPKGLKGIDLGIYLRVSTELLLFFLRVYPDF